MSNKTKKETNLINDRERNQSNERYDAYNASQVNQGQNYYDQGNESYGGAKGVYDHLAKGFSAGDPGYDMWGGGPGGTGGGISGGGYSARGYQGEGYNAEGYETKQPQYHLRGIDASHIADAKKGYGEFAETGGMNEEARGNFRLRGNAAVPSFYSNMKNEMANRRNVQGGYGSGFDAADEALARKSAQGTYETALNTEGSLQDRITSGRQWGIGGQADLGKFSQDLQLRHDTTEGQFSEAFANRQDAAGMFSAGGRNDAAAFGANARNQSNQFNASEQNNAAAFGASQGGSASMFNARLAEDARQFNIDTDTRRRTTAGSGYSGLYSDANQASASANQRWLGGLAQQDQQNRGSIDSRYQYNKGPNWAGWGSALLGLGGSAVDAYSSSRNPAVKPDPKLMTPRNPYGINEPDENNPRP